MQGALQKKHALLTPKANFARMLLMLLAGLLLCTGGSLLAVGMYMQLKFAFVAEIIGSALAVIAAYLGIVSGFCVMFVALLGGWGARSLSRCSLVAFLAAMVLLALLALAASLMALLFKASLASGARQSMLYSLRRHYGKHRLVTDAWDQAQTRLRCCAVDSLGWSAFNNSEWDLAVNADERNYRRKISQWSPLYKFVPESCCLRLLDPRTLWPADDYRSLQQCQYWPYGPPNYRQGGLNDALYYQGCFDAGSEVLWAHSNLLTWLGLLLFVFMIGGIGSAAVLLGNLPGQLAAIRNAADRSHSRHFGYRELHLQQHIPT